MGAKRTIWQRYRQLKLWNRLGAWGNLASLVALPLGLLIALSVGYLFYRMSPTVEDITVAATTAHQRTLADYADQFNPTNQIERLRNSLALTNSVATSGGAAGTSRTDNIQLRISEAIGQIPVEIESGERAELDALAEEARLQALARDMDREFRPQVERVIDVIADTVRQAAEAGLVRIESQSAKLQLPPEIAFTTFVMAANNMQKSQPDNSMSWTFPGAVSWDLYLTVGMLRSPGILAKPWDAPTDHYYPMLRLQHRAAAARFLLGTVNFDLKSKELEFFLNGRNSLPEKSTMAIDAIQESLTGYDRIAAIIVELLKAERTQSVRGHVPRACMNFLPFVAFCEDSEWIAETGKLKAKD